jgi:hypothetical protein
MQKKQGTLIKLKGEKFLEISNTETTLEVIGEMGKTGLELMIIYTDPVTNKVLKSTGILLRREKKAHKCTCKASKSS